VLRKYFKPSIYLAILLIPFCIVFFKPKSLKAVAVLDAAAGPVGWAQDWALEFKKLFYYRETYDAYVKLKKQTDLLKARIVFLQNALQGSGRMEQIAQLRRNQPYTTALASVIGRDPSNWNASLILDKGSEDGIKIGMPVLSPLGVAGRIVEAGRTTSKAALVSDPNFSVAAVVERSRESGLLTGTLQGICRLQYLTEKADVKVGDRVVTSKLSSVFPEGLLIGYITDVQASANSNTVECLVDPAVDLSQLEEAVIIKK